MTIRPVLAYLSQRPANVWKSLRTGATIAFTGTQPPPTPGFEFTVEVSDNDFRGPPNTSDTSFNLAGMYARVTAANVLNRTLGGRQKYFDNNQGITQAVSNWNNSGGNKTERIPVFCFKTFTTTELNNHLTNNAFPQVWVFNQEFDSTSSSAWTSYNNSYASLKSIRDAHINGHFVELQMVFSASAERTGPNAGTEWITFPDYTKCDSFGADTYNARYPPFTPQAAFDHQIAAFQHAKTVNSAIKWRVAEWGISMYSQAPTSAGAGNGVKMPASERIQHFDDQLNYAKAAFISSMTYWAINNEDSAPIKNWSIDLQDGISPVFAAHLAATITASGL